MNILNKKYINTFIVILFLSLISLFFYFLSREEGFEFSKNEVGDNKKENIIKDNDKMSEESESGNIINESTEFALDVPDDFSLVLYAESLGKVRNLVSAPSGVIASLMTAGQVVYLPDLDLNYKADEKIVLAEDLYNPHGLLEYCPSEDFCKFYIAETDAVSIYDYDKNKVSLTNPQKIIDLPDDGGHYTRSLALANVEGEDKLLISVGSKCDVCVEDDWRRAKVLQSNLDGSNLEVFAEGLRNSVYIKENPFTGEIWGTDMGRDWLGDNLPPEEVNIIKKGGDYGWPFCYGEKIHDTEFDKNTYIRDPCEDTIAPHISMPAHIAPLGLDFIPQENWPEEYQYNLLVAQHGSWNSSVPVGYKVVRMKLNSEGDFLGKEDFVSGFIKNGEVAGRPADILVSDDGRIYLSDDGAGRIFVIFYQGE